MTRPTGPAQSPDGYVYVLHLERKMGKARSAEEREEYGLAPRQDEYTSHAQHYCGHADDLRERLQQHFGGYGSAFTRQAVSRDIKMTVARVWKGGYEVEQALKRKKKTPAYCPCCSPRAYNLRGAEELTEEQIRMLLGDLYVS